MGERKMVPKSQTEYISLVIFFSQLCLQSPILRWLRPKAAPRLNEGHSHRCLRLRGGLETHHPRELQ